MAITVSYTTVSLMQMTLAEIGSITTLNSATCALHASNAQAIMNAKLARRYSLPFIEAIPVLETLATDLAIYNALTGRIVIKDDHPWFQRFKGAADMVDAIACGSMSLVTSGGELVSLRSDEASGMQPWSNNKDYFPTHWEADWSLHITDSDKIDDQADDRDLGDIRDRLT